MSFPISRNGDTGSGCGGNGTIVGASSHWTLRGSLVALNGDSYSCSKHGSQSLIASHRFSIHGKSIVRVGDRTTCGATINTGANGATSGAMD